MNALTSCFRGNLFLTWSRRCNGYWPPTDWVLDIGLATDEHRYTQMGYDVEMSDPVELTGRIIGSAYTVANELGHGFLEKVYENALAIQLRKDGMSAFQQHAIPVRYDGELVGDFFADLLVEKTVIVELKASKKIDDLHLAQLLNYLKATQLNTGLLLNFGTPRVQIKRVSL